MEMALADTNTTSGRVGGLGGTGRWNNDYNLWNTKRAYLIRNQQK